MSSFARALRRQAQHDFDHAQPARAMGDVDWAVLAAQQAGEKALKAVLVFAGRRAEPTHSLGGLFDALVAAATAPRCAPRPSPGCARIFAGFRRKGRRASSCSAPLHAAISTALRMPTG